MWCGVALVAFYAALWALTGFDLPGSLEAANSAYVRGISSQRPYWYWVVGSPTAFFVALGLPLAWLVARGAGRGELTAIAILGLVVLSALLGFTKAENERIWQFTGAPGLRGRRRRAPARHERGAGGAGGAGPGGGGAAGHAVVRGLGERQRRTATAHRREHAGGGTL